MGIVDNGTQFQFATFNAGQTPGLNVTAYGSLVIDGATAAPVNLLGDGKVSVYQNLPSPQKFIWNLDPADFTKLISSPANKAVLTLKYQDYAGEDRETASTFVVLKSPDRPGYQLQMVNQTLR